METHPYRTVDGLKTQLNWTDADIGRHHARDGGIWFENTRRIICGTFPPLKEYQNRQGYLHFSSPKNKFWRHVDALYGTSLYIPSDVSANRRLRIENAQNKVCFLMDRLFGFVDIFTKIDRQHPTSDDADIIERETIFENGIFDDLVMHQVSQFIFVYSLARDVFERNIVRHTQSPVQLIRAYNTENIPLEIKYVDFCGKRLYLTYAPIHGKISDERKRQALQGALELYCD